MSTGCAHTETVCQCSEQKGRCGHGSVPDCACDPTGGGGGGGTPCEDVDVVGFREGFRPIIDPIRIRPRLIEPHRFVQIGGGVQIVCGRAFIIDRGHVLPGNRRITLSNGRQIYGNGTMLDPGESYQYSVPIENPGNTEVTWEIAVNLFSLDNWTVDYSPYNVTLEPYESTNINVVVTAPTIPTTVYQNIMEIATIPWENPEGDMTTQAMLFTTLSTIFNPVFIESEYIDEDLTLAIAVAEDLVNTTGDLNLEANVLLPLQHASDAAMQPQSLELSFNYVRRAITYLDTLQTTEAENLTNILLTAVWDVINRMISVAENQVTIDELVINESKNAFTTAYEWSVGCGNNNYRSMQLYIHSYMLALEHSVADYYSSSIYVSDEQDSILPGESINYTIGITNTGLLDDSFKITFSSFLWDEGYFETPILEPGQFWEINNVASLASDWIQLSNTSVPLSIYSVSQISSIVDAYVYSESNFELRLTTTKESMARYVLGENERLIDVLAGMDIHHGIKNSLHQKLEGSHIKLEFALTYILMGDNAKANNMLTEAQNKLNAFSNQVNAQMGKKISEFDAEALLTHANNLRIYADSTKQHR